jgi:hypothetical protein
MTIQSFLKKPLSAGLIWGTIGGISLILMTLISTNGLVQISPYPVILIAAILTMKYNRPQGNVFNQLFVTGLFTFVIMSLILYVYIFTFINPGSGYHLNWRISFLNHLSRFGFIIIIGTMSSMLLSFLAKPVK